MSEFIFFMLAVVGGIIFYVGQRIEKAEKEREQARKYHEALARQFDWSSLKGVSEVRRALRQIYIEQSNTLGLTCRRCEHIASPILDSSNRYRCPECGNQFAGAVHHISTARIFMVLPANHQEILLKACEFESIYHAQNSANFGKLIQSGIQDDTTKPTS